MKRSYVVGGMVIVTDTAKNKPRLHWNKVWQCWQVSNPLALPRSTLTVAAHAAHSFNVVNDRVN